MRSELDEAFSLVDEGRILELAKGLIRVPSVTGGEREVSYRAKELIEESGVTVELHGSEERPVVVSTINPETSPLLVFNGHLD
ncbi:MAG: hypothetical protein NWE75_02830, partial [Candidatus Bathyarchaeota archaeon]|nr:hypothetical protein [Candidatus Bathyarchaeota archaeon]